MATKLGYHVQGWTPGTLATVLHSKAPILKVMSPEIEPVLEVTKAVPDLTLVLRMYFDDGRQLAYLRNREKGGKEAALEIVRHFERLLRKLPKATQDRTYVEGLNEIGLWDDAAAYSAFTVGFAETCRALGVRPAVYSFATGNPPGYRDGSREDLAAYWAHYHDGLEAAREANGALALHEYDAPTMRRLAGWLCLRYRKVWEALPERLRLPVIITECGIDGGVLGAPIERAGWRGYTNEHDYALELAWYDEELLKDDGVIGATIFTAGNLDIWTSFDVTNVWPVADLIRLRGEVTDIPLLPASNDAPPPTALSVVEDVRVPEIVHRSLQWRELATAVVSLAPQELWLPLIALGIAESNLRSNARRPASSLYDEQFWPDVSFGAWQQTVRWSQEYLDWARASGHPPAEFPGSSVIERIGQQYYNIEKAMSVASTKLLALGIRSDRVLGWGDDDGLLDLLCRYNAPTVEPVQNRHRTRYQASIRQARNLLKELNVSIVPMGRIGNLKVFAIYEALRHQYALRDFSDIRDISIHHSATPTLSENASFEDEWDLLMSIQRYHSAQFKGFAYHLAVAPSGRVYWTGAWDTIRYVVGGDRNRSNLAICLLGDFSTKPPGETQLNAARALIENVWMQLGSTSYPVLAHREISPTACPGDTWKSWIDSLRRPPEDHGAPTNPVKVQLDTIWGWSERVGQPARNGIQAAVQAIKEHLGLS